MPSSAPHLSCTLSLHDALPISLVERLTVGWDLNQEWAAGQLALHPDTVTRAQFSQLAQADSSRHCVAAILGSGDPSPWVRRTLLRSEEHTSELQSPYDLVCRLLHPTCPALFPYTTLFRSHWSSG